MKYCDACKTAYPNDFAVCPRDQSNLRVTSELMQGVVIRNKYEVLDKIGVGGMATVYKAKHLTFGELRAIKVVSSKLLDDELFMKRFKTEAIVTRKLKHMNAVRVEDFDETEDGRPFIVMEYVEGMNLRQAIHEQKPMPVERALEIARQATAVLAAAHQLGITHRDIKPDNILLIRLPDGSEQVKILDFGIAKLKEGSLDHTSYTPTQTGMVMGTPQYISPEQALGRTGDEVDGRADLYSLGVVLYEMLCGELPFRSDTPIGLLMHHIHTLPTPPHTVKPDLPPAIAQLLLKCLEKDRAQRFQSADELLEALNRPEMTATTEMLGSTTFARGNAASPSALIPSSAPRPTPPPSAMSASAAAGLAAAAKPASAVVTPPGVAIPTPVTGPLTPAPRATPRETPRPVVTPEVPAAPPKPRVATARVNVPTLTSEPKSHRSLYGIVAGAAVIVLVMVAFALFRPRSEPVTQAPGPDPVKVAADIQRLLNSSPVLQKHPLTATFKDGTATINGIVEDQSELELAQALTANVPGVTAVVNQLSVQVPDRSAEGKLAAEHPAEPHRAEPQAPPAQQPETLSAAGADAKGNDELGSAGGADSAIAIEDDVNATREQRVRKLVETGYRDLESTPPKGRRAYFAFKRALELEPGNQRALAGLQRLEMMRRQQQQQNRAGQIRR